MFNYKIELADRSFNKLEELQHLAISPSWEYSLRGGCGSFGFSLPINFCTERNLAGFFNIKVKVKNPSTGSYDLWYQGRLLEKTPDVVGDNEVISISGHGYEDQLNDIYLDNVNYASMTIEDIVDDIMDTYVVPNTDITKGTISATGVTATDITFNTTAKNAIQTCAEIVGSREYGVDRNRTFFFKERSSTVGHVFPLGGKVKSFNSQDSFSDITNRLIVRGGDVAGTPFQETFNDTISQLKYGRRDSIYQNSAITNSTDAQAVATARFAEFNDVVRRASCTIVGHEVLIEDTTPIDLFQLRTAGVTYGTKRYGEFLYSGRINYQINRINYSIDSSGGLITKFSLGRLRPSVAENLAQLEFGLEQVSSASL